MTAEREYVARLLGLQPGSAQAEAPINGHSPQDRVAPATAAAAISADELDRLFEMVTLLREVRTGRLDRMGMFDETAITWDVSRPWLDLRARELGCAAEGALSSSPQRRFQVLITHDIDRLSGWEPTALVKYVAGRLGLKPAWRPQANALRVTHWLRNLDRLLQYEVDNGIRAYYFVLSGPYGLRRYSSRYDSRWRQAKEAVRLIADAGMVVGLHGSYYAREHGSYRDERRRLEDVTGTAVTCHRNHYLRFDPLRIWSQLEAAGIEYDFSVGFNYRMGFRAGCGNVYSAFDLALGRTTTVMAVPLLLMDNVLAVRDRVYGLGECRRALEDVRRVGGCVSLLFHPEGFVQNSGMLSLFEDVVALCEELGADLSGSLPARLAGSL